MDIERWQSLMQRMGVAENADTFEKLLAAYSEPHRFYHTTEHISKCLEHLDEATHLAGSHEEVEAALWFHDAVYDPQSEDNEARSASWAAEFLTYAGLCERTSTRVRDHILATQHDAAPCDADSALVVDIDLAILGSTPPEYQVFETNVRKEYEWVPGPLFRRKRRAILSSFLERPNIYLNEHWRSRYEASARGNLRSAIRALGG
ncbi:MAG: HD domain-containing protein [Gammaproteobacteria bacterium]